MMSDTVTRKEYEERNTAIQIQMVNLNALAQSDASAIHELSILVAKQSDAIGSLMTSLAVLKDRTKILYPALGIAASVVSFLLGGKFF